MRSRAEQFWKAWAGIWVIPSGTVTEVREEQPWKGLVWSLP